MCHAVLAVVSNCCPPLKGRFLTRYSPVRHCPLLQLDESSFHRFSFDLHVLSTPPAFVLSQDQTLHKSFMEKPIWLFFFVVSKLYDLVHLRCRKWDPHIYLVSCYSVFKVPRCRPTAFIVYINSALMSTGIFLFSSFLKKKLYQPEKKKNQHRRGTVLVILALRIEPVNCFRAGLREPLLNTASRLPGYGRPPSGDAALPRRRAGSLRKAACRRNRCPSWLSAADW